MSNYSYVFRDAFGNDTGMAPAPGLTSMLLLTAATVILGIAA